MGSSGQNDQQSLQKLLQQLWQATAGNPRHQALVVARAAANHGDSTIRQWAINQIRIRTPEGPEKREALKLLSPLPPLLPPVQVDWTAYALRVDPELGRLAIVLHLAQGLRLWVVCRDLVRSATKGKLAAGRVPRQLLKERLKALGIGYTARHINRLLAASDGLFWNLSPDAVHIRSVSYVAEQLVLQAAQTCPETIATNKPGVREVYLPVGGSLEQWEAMLYAGWLTHRENPTIARETLAQLFGRSADSLRRWEAMRLSHILTIRTNYAQAVLDEDLLETLDYVLPSQAYSYVASGVEGPEIRLRWQLPNTYNPAQIRQHHCKGQASRVRKRVNASLARPVHVWRDGMQGDKLEKLYWNDAKKLRRYLKRHTGLRYLWLGENPQQQGVFEATTNGWVQTKLRERWKLRAEKAYLACVRKGAAWRDLRQR